MSTKAGATVWLLPGWHHGTQAQEHTDRSSLYVVWTNGDLDYVIVKSHLEGAIVKYFDKNKTEANEWHLYKPGDTGLPKGDDKLQMIEHWEGHLDGTTLCLVHKGVFHQLTPKGDNDYNAQVFQSVTMDTIKIDQGTSEWSSHSVGHQRMGYSGVLTEHTIEVIRSISQDADKATAEARAKGGDFQYNSKTGDMDTTDAPRDDTGIAMRLGSQEPQAPKTPHEDLQPPTETVESLNRKMAKVGGKTYRVDGDDYYIVNVMNNQSVVIHSSPGRPMPPQFHQLNGPNSFFIDALFKFVRNIEGTNGYGAKIMIEVYEPYTDEEILKIAPNSWQGAAARAKAAKTEKPQVKATHGERGIGIAEQPTPNHNARKARAAYLLQHIIDLGNEIDRFVADNQNPVNYWKSIETCQNELLNIYKVELRNACSVEDEHAISVLKANIDKLTRGREYAWNAIKNCR
jgi:hypothetical protein